MPHHAGTARYQYQYNQNDLGLASTVDWDHVIVIGGPLLFYLNKWKGVAEWVHEMGREGSGLDLVGYKARGVVGAVG